MTTITCSECGFGIDSRGLKAHRDSGPCVAAAAWRRYYERGWLPVHASAARILRRVGIPHAVDAYKWRSGWAGRRGRMVEACYAPSWAVVIVGRTGIEVAERERMLRAAAAERLEESAHE